MRDLTQTAMYIRPTLGYVGTTIPTLGRPTSLYWDRILYWLCDVALVVEATTSASKTRVQLKAQWMIDYETLQIRNTTSQIKISYVIFMNAVRR